MKLLSADEVKNNGDKSRDENIQKVIKLKKEEARLNQKINNLIEDEKERENLAIAAKMRDQATLKVKKSILEKEVDVLEKRKQEALRPIRSIQEETEKINQECKSQIEDIEKQKIAIKQERESLIEKSLDLENQKESVIDRQKDLSDREICIEAAEKEIKRSTNELSKKWVGYHEEVGKTNKDIEKRNEAVKKAQKEADDQRKSNESIRLELEESRKRLEREDKAIQDKYLALRAAQREILGHEE